MAPEPSWAVTAEALTSERKTTLTVVLTLVLRLCITHCRFAGLFPDVEAAARPFNSRDTIVEVAKRSAHRFTLGK